MWKNVKKNEFDSTMKLIVDRFEAIENRLDVVADDVAMNFIGNEINSDYVGAVLELFREILTKKQLDKKVEIAEDKEETIREIIETMLGRLD